MKSIKDIGDFIFVKDEPKPVDIVFIPGGSHPELGEQAAVLMNKGLAKWVMPCGGVSVKTGKFDGVKSKREVYSKDYVTEYAFLEDVLMVSGVAKDKILKEDQSGMTKENATFARKRLDELNINIKSAMICCKSFHARRALMYYQFAFPETVFFVVPYDYIENGHFLTKETWFQSETGIKRVLGEMQRIGLQFFEDIRAHSLT